MGGPRIAAGRSAAEPGPPRLKAAPRWEGSIDPRLKAQAKAIAEAIPQELSRRRTRVSAPPPAHSVLPSVGGLEDNLAVSDHGDRVPDQQDTPLVDGYSRRRSPRKTALSNAKIVCPNDRRGIDCRIIDTSDSGALLSVDNSYVIAEMFVLYDFGEYAPHEKYTKMPHRQCQLVWRKRNKVGVKFVD